MERSAEPTGVQSAELDFDEPPASEDVDFEDELDESDDELSDEELSDDDEVDVLDESVPADGVSEVRLDELDP